jgi:hypothetical protein
MVTITRIMATHTHIRSTPTITRTTAIHMATITVMATNTSTAVPIHTITRRAFMIRRMRLISIGALYPVSEVR